MRFDLVRQEAEEEMARVSALAICTHQAANNRAGHSLAR